MTLYITSVRQWWAAPAALSLLTAVCLVVGKSEVPVPSITSGMGGVQLAFFTPVLVVIAVMYCLDRNLGQAETTAVVPIGTLDQGIVAVTAGLAHLVGLLVGMDIARNTVLLLAVALLVRRLINEAAATVAGLMVLILSLVAGRAYDPNGFVSHTWWALALYPADNVTAWLITTLMFALALHLTLARR
ncbi:hypothetical protein GPZ77_33405 [Streptomyces sp. QHH-9511]|uniref:hypothetical protein n=1 Tax=Streptomyces sp. QHH-9511 TaxID=2684468 RepID=UPI0013188FF1|nr:hypothetical protein [Streptomyces sp. QHH-9511]QGZ52558.1 hypothetical protein GPZ77_33405 [Streptomyces sp. QHH-9511]